MRRAVSVIKKRYSAHEQTIRELRMSEGSIEVGEPIEEFSGILTGTPTYEGHRRRLIDDENSDRNNDGG